MTTMLHILVDGDGAGSPPQFDPSTPTINGIQDFVLQCDHCYDEYTALGAPLACGHNICNCYCDGVCPDELEIYRMVHSMQYNRVLDELMVAIPEYDS